MDTNEEKLLLKDEVFQIVGCAIEVLNTLGHGLVEKPYENALVVEFGLRKIPFRQQPPFDVVYKGQKVGLFVPDLVAFDSVVVALRVKTNSGERVWLGDHAGDGGPVSPFAEKGATYRPYQLAFAEESLVVT